MVLRRVSRAAVLGGLRQVGRFGPSRRALHRINVASKGHGIVFFRCRRVLPDSARGREHIDTQTGSALSPRELRRELASLDLRFVHLGEAVSLLREGRRVNENLAVLTFDESFAVTAEQVLPILDELTIPATFFVSTAHLDGSRTLWDQEVHHLVAARAPDALSVPWIDRVMRTDSVKGRARAVRRLLMLLASLDEDRLEERRADLFERSGGTPPLDPLDRMLTDGELSTLSEHRAVSIAAHGHRHLAFGSINPRALDDELQTPRKILREIAGAAYLDVVSYPFGRAPYVNDAVITRAREVGYLAGFSASPGLARPGDHLFRLPRTPLGGGLAHSWELSGLAHAVDQAFAFSTGSERRVLEGLEGPPEG